MTNEPLLAGLCPVCGGTRRVLYYGSKPYAELRACSQCSTGEMLADTILPTTWAC